MGLPNPSAIWASEVRRQSVSTQALSVRIEQTKERLSRLTDAFIDRHIDEATFHAKQELTQLELRRLEEEQVAARDERAQFDNMTKFFELVKSLAALYDSAEPREKREIVLLASSNRWLDGKTIVLEPSDWLVPLKNAATVGSGAPYRPTLRMPKQQVVPTSPTVELTAEQVQQLFAVAGSEPVRALQNMLVASARCFKGQPAQLDRSPIGSAQART